MALPSAIIQRGTRGAQPVATAVAAGTIYCVTDEHNILERSTGSAWQGYSSQALAVPLQFGAGVAAGWSPSDSTTYYVGSPLPLDPSTGTLYGVSCPVTGTLTKAYVTAIVTGTAATTENITIRVRNITSATNVDVTTTAQWNTATPAATTSSSTALSLAVTAGDKLAIQIVTPAWATNPTAVYVTGVAWVVAT